MKKSRLYWRTAFLFCMLNTATLAATPTIPGSVNPGLVGKNYLPVAPTTPAPPAASAITAPKAPSPSVEPAPGEVVFTLNNIVLSGNHIYTTGQLAPLYQKELRTIISLPELKNIVQDITNFYRNHGYILSRAVLAPQIVKGGVIHIQIIEGYIDHIKVTGDVKNTGSLLLAYTQPLLNVRPTTMAQLEKYLRIANEIPGVQVKAVLEPSTTHLGASTLNLVATLKRVDASLTYDNHGTVYLGPQQLTGTIAINSLIRPGDTTQLTYLNTTNNKALHYIDVSHQTPIGSHGLTLTVGGNRSETAPGLNLQTLDTRGTADTYYTSLQYPLIRSREQDLTLDTGFSYVDSKTTLFGNTTTLYNDEIRPIKIGGTYRLSDSFNGTSVSAAHIERGLGIMGADTDSSSPTASRFGATGVFTKLTAQISHLQPISNRFSLLATTTGQYTLNPLLSSEQFGFGGSQIGRGYDPSELLGDQGLAGSLELRADLYPEFLKLQNIQLYSFYDIGKIWNKNSSVSDTPANQSAASAGLGLRFAFNRFLSGDLMYAQPLTKDITSEALLNRGRNPKVFFSLTSSV